MAEKLSVSIIGRITDLMSGGVVAKNNLTHYALVFGQMRFLDEVIIGVVFVLQDKSKLFLWPKNFTTKKPSALIQIPANFFAHLSILARSSGDSFVTGRIGLVDSARAISVKDNADANIAAATNVKRIRTPLLTVARGPTPARCASRPLGRSALIDQLSA